MYGTICSRREGAKRSMQLAYKLKSFPKKLVLYVQHIINRN